ncbi:hypothetical protein EV363DRAFT_679850 [Boletus edulis]|nr:hypothetical protein EV363DRAFT_679850 [Boletus edulis]
MPTRTSLRLPLAQEESMKDFAPCHAQLSIRGKRVLDRLLVLLPSHLRSQSTSRRSPFPSTLLLSICNALQLHRADISAEQDDPSVLPSALSKLRDWRLLDPEYRCSPEGIYKLALDLAGITDEASVQTTSDLSHTSHPRLRIKWVGLDSPGESQDRESPSSTPPSPSSSRSIVFDSAQERAHALTDLNKRRSDARYESCQVGRLGTPDSEDSSVVVSPRRHSASGFRSGCSACRHLRLSGLSSTRPLSPIRDIRAVQQCQPVRNKYQPLRPVAQASEAQCPTQLDEEDKTGKTPALAVCLSWRARR